MVCQIVTASDWHYYAAGLADAENSYAYLYPVLINIGVSFLVLNLFVAVITFGFGQVPGVAK